MFALGQNLKFQMSL